jgi:hypothetical protein
MSCTDIYFSLNAIDNEQLDDTLGPYKLAAVLWVCIFFFLLRRIAMRCFRWLYLSVLLALILASVPLVAQKITGDISGDVTDSSGAVLPNATVTVKSAATGLTRSATTTSSGSYRVTDLPIGAYTVGVSAQGFKNMNQRVQVVSNAVVRASFRMEVGSREETVTVQAEAPLVDLSPNNNNYVDQQKIESVPLNGRDFNSLLAITPGVQRAPGGGFLAISIADAVMERAGSLYFGRMKFRRVSYSTRSFTPGKSSRAPPGSFA